MDIFEDEEFEKYLEKQLCRGCSNRCLLVEPNCNRSKIFIREAYEKYIEMKENNI